MGKSNERRALEEDQDQEEEGDPLLQNHEGRPAVKMRILRVKLRGRKGRARSIRSSKRRKAVSLRK
eukprot:10581332-Karenia_brevis.AAC.1